MDGYGYGYGGEYGNQRGAPPNMQSNQGKPNFFTRYEANGILGFFWEGESKIRYLNFPEIY